MRDRTLSILGALATLGMLLLLARGTYAETMFDVARFQAMADDTPAETIPVGTKITTQNWKQYAKFMPVWLQTLYTRDYHWHIGDSPEFTIEVGPTHDFVLPKKFREDTEKYAGQVTLEKASTAGR
jgi:hypothetical protein